MRFIFIKYPHDSPIIINISDQIMKKHLLITLVMMAATAIPAYTADGSQPKESRIEFFADGKSWDYLECDVCVPENGMYYTTVTVVGDISVNGIDCKRLMTTAKGSDAVSYSAGYEKDGKVYVLAGNDFELKFDFNVGIGATLFGNATDIETITVNGVDRRKITFENGAFAWIEGIGQAVNNCEPTASEKPVGFQTYTLACNENGTTVFTYDDFFGKAAVPENYEYRPLAVEGRTWWYSCPAATDGGKTTYCGITIKGRADINGAEWMKCHYIGSNGVTDAEPFGYIREAGRQVYFKAGPAYKTLLTNRYQWLDNTSETLIYDFNLKTLEAYTIGAGNSTPGTPVLATDISYPSQGGKIFKSIRINCHSDNPYQKIIVGVGIDSEGQMMCCPFGQPEPGKPQRNINLAYVTDADGSIFYKAAGGVKPWQEYSPLAVEGRTWWYSYTEFGDFEQTPRACAVRIGDETVENGVKWNSLVFIDKDMAQAPKPFGLIREEDQKVYVHLSDIPAPLFTGGLRNDAEQVLVYDFTLDCGETVPAGFGTAEDAPVIKGIEYVTNSGTSHRTILVEGENVPESTIVEGVGITGKTETFFAPFTGKVPSSPQPMPELTWVTDRDNNIYYEAAGGKKPWETDGIEAAETDSATETISITDLAGRPSTATARGIYIETLRHADGTVSARKIKR